MNQTAVLVVDDEAGVRRSICRFLELRGLAVEEAADGNAALARLRERPFDAVVSDISMPELGGIELWNKVAAELPDMRERFVFASALPKPSSLDAESVTFLRKPFELQQLWSALQAILAPSPPSQT